MTTTASNTPLAGMTITAKNLGPLRGEHDLATIDGPGIWEAIGPNTGGKSTLLRLMMMFGEKRLLASDADHVTDGELEGFLHMEPARLIFTTSSDGTPQTPRRENAALLPTIEEIPNPIELLISGGSSRQRTVKDPAARARNRLEQLLVFAPFEVDRDTVERLGRCMDDRVFTDTQDPSHVVAWDMLMAQVESKVTRFKPISVMRPDAVLAHVLDEAGTGSILDAQQSMLKLLNRLAKAAEHAAKVQGVTLGQLDGRIEEAVAAAGRRLNETPTPTLRQRLESWEGDLAQLRDDLELARSGAARTRVAYERRQEEQGRRDTLSDSHGDRPSTADEEARVATRLREQQAATAAHDEAEGQVTAAREEHSTARQAAEASLTEMRDRWADWRKAVDAMEARFGSPSSVSSVRVPMESDLDTEQVTEALNRLALVQIRARVDAERVDAAVGALESAQAVAGDARRDRDIAQGHLEGAEESLGRAQKAVERWEETAKLIAEPVPGPDEEEVREADGVVERIRAEIAMSESRDDLLAVIAEQATEQGIMDWLERMENDYRDAAAATWTHLGSIMTDSLSLPWLRVDGLEMRLIYDRETGRLATAETDEAQLEVRNLDDQKRVSTAEIHEAMLRLMIDRRATEVTEAGRAPIIILPWDYERPSAIAALDDERKRRFAAAVEEAGLVIFAERPRRDGEPEEVHMVKVEALHD